MTPASSTAAFPQPVAAPAHSPRFVALVFAAMSLAVVGLGAFAFRTLAVSERRGTEEQLSGIAAIRAGQIEAWWAERRANARALKGNRQIARTAADWLVSPTEETQAILLDRMDSFRVAYGLIDVALFDAAGIRRLNTGTTTPGSEAQADLARDALAKGDIAFSGLRRLRAAETGATETGAGDGGGSSVALDIAVPLPGAHPDWDGGFPAALVLTVDAGAFLLPLIRDWPLPDSSAEIIVGQRDGDRAVIVNRRHGAENDGPMSLRLPLDDVDLPVAAALNGQTGLFEGRDYRDVPVVAALRSIPGTGLALVAKIDRREITAHLYRTAAIVGGIGILVLAAAGFLIGQRLRREEARFYRTHYMAERDLRLALQRSQEQQQRTAAALADSEERYRCLFLGARVAQLIIDPSDGAIVDANPAAAAYYGYPVAVLRTMTIAAINTLSPEEVAAEMARARREQRNHFRFRHRLASGELRDVEVHSGPMMVGERQLLYSIVHDVTDRAGAEAALRASEDRYHTLVRLSPAGIVHIDATGTITYVSRRWCELAGLSVEDLRRMGWENTIDREDRDRVVRAWADAFGHAEEFRAEFRYRHADDSILWVAVTAVPETAADGTLLGYVAAVTDITRIKALEADLCRALDRQTRTLEALERTKLSLDNAQRIGAMGNWEWDPAAAGTWWSAEMYRLFGLEPDALSPPAWSMTERQIHPDDLPAMRDSFQAVLEGRRPVIDLDFRVTLPNGTERILHSRAEAVRGPNGAVLRLTGIVQDVTERRHAEAEIRKLSSVVEQVPVSIVITDPSGLIEYVNPFFERITGFSAADVRGQTPRLLRSGRHSAQEYAILWQTILSGQIWRGELVNKTKAGDLLWEAASIAPLRGTDGGIKGFVGIKIDITARKQAEERLAAALEGLKASNRDLERFAYVASHDLREPLRTMSSFIGLLERQLGGTLDADAAEFMGFIKDGARRMDRMITGLLEYSRIGRKGSPPAPASLGPVLAQAIRVLGAAIEESGAVVAVDASIGDAAPVLWMDENEIERLLQNLIGNALKYRAPGVRPEVRVSAAPGEGDTWTVSVTDNGIGIAAKDFERIFGIFQRLHGRDEYEGTGIGLAVCRRIVERHGGRIWVESEPGAGSTFHFTLKSGEPTA